MCNRKFLLLLLFILFQLKAFSAVFVVTSNADSGPGTLRDALTQAAANGNTEKDYINFNLQDLSVAGRTITLLSNLPTINSDMIIDGSTQPGTALSVNGAKVVIGGNYYDPNAYIDYFYVENVNTFEADGLIIKGLYSNYNSSTGVQVFIIGGNNKSIKLGQPGKGNVIYNCSEALEFTVGEGSFPNKSSTDSLILKNNFIGVEEDGITIADNIQSGCQANYVSNIIFGGETKAEGNVFYGLVSLSPSYGTDVLKKNSTVYLKNNIFGANSQEKRTTDPNINTDWNSFYLSIGAYYQDTGPYSSVVQITDNVFGYEVSLSGFQKLNMVMQHNYFGVSEDQQTSLPIKAAALTLNYMKGTMLIGGSDNSKANVFAHCGQDSTDSFYVPGVIEVTENNTVHDPQFKVELSHNSFYCNNTYPFFYALAPDKKPISVTVDNLTATNVNGTVSQPNARIELFYTDKECTQCQPKTYLATTYADANGKWAYNGSLLTGYGVMAGANNNQISSEFTDTRIYSPLQSGGYPSVTNAECDLGGSILGMYTVNAKKIAWLNSSNQVVGTDLNLVNVPAGKYRLKAEQFGCVIYSPYYEIQDYTPTIDSLYVRIINPSCGGDGSISNLQLAYFASYEWLDESGKVVSNQLDINNLAAGKYTLQVTGQRGCVKTYGPITLKNATSLTIDQSQQQIQSTNCGQSTGAVTNIRISGGTGTYQYVWLNSSQQQVSTGKDLTGQPAGVYKLQVNDGGSCGPVYSSDITIPETNGITLDESKATATSASCNLSNGSVTGLTITGATQYVWVDAGGKSYTTTTPDLTGVPAGSYTLTASNGTGCTKTSQAYQIGQKPPIQFQLGMANSINLTCSPTLSASISLTAPDPGMKSFRWVNSQNQTVGTGQTINNLLPGTYQLYITDENGCENYYSSYVVPQYSKFAVAPSSEIVNEQCGLKNGSIGAANVTGGIPPYAYSWTDASGTQIGTDNTIANLAAGTYFLNVSDGACGNIILSYTITEETEDIPPPSVSNVQLCSSGSAMLSVNNASDNTTYRLYDDAKTTQPLAGQTGGRFNVTVSANRSYFISQLNGTCESSRAEVKVTVGLSTLSIANTFTPNGDGINDYWQISNINNYPNALVQVFNRYGLKLFESKGYTKPFDGTSNGKELPSGVYYYIINLSTNCNLLSGSLTIIR